MAKIIFLALKRSRLPRRLLDDGWWLESKPAQPTVVAFPTRKPPKPAPGRERQRRHLILVISEK